MLNLHKLVRDALLDDATHSRTLRACLERDGARAFRYFDRILRSREAYASVGLDLTEFSSLLPFDISSLSTPLLVCLLTSSAGQTAQLIGALAVLSEFGREQDRPLIETFVKDKRARVAAEAARALRRLG
jgi:hypothetical protein